MITLYHGSDVEITRIDFNMCKKGKDFGKGFYLNPNFTQARDMAVRTARVTGTDTPVVNEFVFDNEAALCDSQLNIKVFDSYTEEWAEFVVNNRKNRTDTQAHEYDIVIGPIANDTVGVQIRRYAMGYLTANQLVEELRFIGSTAMQYFFCTPKSLKYLTRRNDKIK